MIDLREAEQLILRTWWLVDAEHGQGVEQLFTEDGQLQFGAALNRGREEIRAVYALRRARGERTARHLVANIRWSTNGGDVVAEYSLILFAADGRAPVAGAGPNSVFDVRDVLTEGSGGLLFSRRTLTTVFTDPAASLAVSFTQSATNQESHT